MSKLPLQNLFLLFIFVFVAGSFALPVAEAKSVVRISDDISITEGDVIEGDFYPAAYKINISGVVDNDINAIGSQITVNGEVGNDALLVAFKTDVHGTIGDDLRIVGYEVTIAEPVAGDVFVIGGIVNVLSTASIAGDLIIFGGQATVEGSVGGDLLGTIDNLRIDGSVAGDVDITVNQLTLGDKTAIEGSVRYVSSLLATQALNATVGGNMVRNDPIIPVKDVTLGSAVLPVLVLLFSTLVWYLVSRKSLNLVVERALTRSVRPVLIGTVALFMTPIAISILWVSIIGSIIGLVVLLGYVLFLLLSIVGLGAVLGQLLMKIFNQPVKHVSLLTLVVGVAGVVLLMLLPVLGIAILLGLMIVTFGAMIDLLIRPNLK